VHKFPPILLQIFSIFAAKIEKIFCYRFILIYNIPNFQTFLLFSEPFDELAWNLLNNK